VDDYFTIIGPDDRSRTDGITINESKNPEYY